MKTLEKLKWNTTKRRVKDLLPWEKNPRRLTPEQAEQLKASISKFDLAEIPAVDTDGRIVAGHQRVATLKLLGRQDYQWQHEPILYGWASGASHRWYGGRAETTIWNIARPAANDEHPTMKPVELCSRAVSNSSRRGGAVLDLFGGSGSTLIACETLKRRAYLMELDPKYVDVIVQRWEAFTGRKARKVPHG